MEVLVPAAIVLVAAAVIVTAVRLVLSADDPRRSRWTRTVLLGTVVALIGVATLAAREPIGVRLDLKLVPFLDLGKALAGDGSVRGAIVEIVANILLFVPFGLALRLRYPDLPMGRIVAFSCVLSLVIEILQLVIATGRVANITDVLTNTLGGAMGALLVRREPVEAAASRSESG